MICLVVKMAAEKQTQKLPLVVSDDVVCLANGFMTSSVKNRESLLEILNHLPYGLFTTDEDERIDYFNAAAEKITGIPAAEAIGLHCRDVFKNDACHNDWTLDKIGGSKENIFICEFNITRPDQVTYPIICTTCALTNRNGIAMKQKMYVFKDIADRKRLEEDLKRSESRYRNIFEGSKDMIFVTYKEGTFRDVNPACVDLLGYGTKEELLALESVEKVCSNPIHWRVFQDQIDRHGSVQDFEAWLQKKDGTKIHCLLSGNAVRGIDGDVVGYEGIVKDITARMDGFRRLRQQNQKLSLLHSVAVAMNVTRDLKSILLVALKKLLEVLDLESGAIFLIDHEQQEFVLKVHQHLLSDADNGKKHRLQLHDNNLMQALLKDDHPLAPQRTFPPFKATLENTLTGHCLELTCFLITRKDRASGFFALAVPENRRIREQDHMILGSLGNFLGSSIENTGLMETIQQHREELKHLTARLFHSQEEERKRIARELHDEAGQALTGINFTIETITKSLSAGLEHVQEQIADVKKQINRTYQEMRNMSYRLHPAVLSDLGLEPALETYLQDIAKYSGLDIDFKMVGFDKRLDADTEIVLYRISQELINNTLKHSGAELFRLYIIKSYPHILFMAEDDGIGFDPSKFDERKQALGLLGIRERVAMIGGSFSIRSSRQEGTRVRIEIPIKESSGEECSEDPVGR